MNIIAAIWKDRKSPYLLVPLATFLIVLVASFWIGPSIFVDTFITGSMWALISVGVSLVLGVMGIPNFAQGEFFMIGGLAAYYTYTKLSALASGQEPLTTLAPVAAIIAGTIAGVIVGAIIDSSIFRVLRKRVEEQWVMETFVTTIGISLMLVNAHQLIIGPQYKGIYRYWPGSVDFLGITVGTDRLVAAGIGMAAIIWITYTLQSTGLGRMMRAVAQDEIGSKMIGINIGRSHLMTFSLSSGLAGLAGASLLFMFPSYPNAGAKALSMCFPIVILAGMGSVGGAIITGFMVAALQALTDYTIGSSWESVLPFVLILVIMAVKPLGLFSTGVRGRWEQ